MTLRVIWVNFTSEARSFFLTNVYYVGFGVCINMVSLVVIGFCEL